MRIWVMSDLHLEFTALSLPLTIPQADVCVVAGDVLTRGVVPSLEWLADNVAGHMPVVFVAGNHEFYDAAFGDSILAGKAFAAGIDNLHFLDGETVDIAGVRFAGGTLWTDFCLHDWQDSAMAEARSRMNDYRKIKYAKKPFRKFLPINSLNKHRLDRTAIETAMTGEGNGRLVIVTHHAPSERSLPTADRATLIAAAYASDLTSMIEAGKPDLWIHGHIHHHSDYMISETRVLANPRGYPGQETFGNFDPAFVVAV
ncbi:phosphatase [Rhizobiales bacterium RZME27]|uniref:Phosphatase n=1 Tax=Endobacterium cereale TaxID=2663029 RepID=A0A6A8A7E0_9HYPH|nr:metallophosphoesterase [Endobacterium cereale]MEB2843264.1 metallophosphoesterase [Endobacterium cereale]MQY47222.1 phosphatase [Endobacterium cereale]